MLKVELLAVDLSPRSMKNDMRYFSRLRLQGIGRRCKYTGPNLSCLVRICAITTSISTTSAIYADVDLAGFTSNARGFRVVGDISSAYFGRAACGIGDINGDGVDDVAVGGPGSSNLNGAIAGGIMVIFGHSTATAFAEVDPLTFNFGTGGFEIYGAEASDSTGFSISRAGDVNGDGVQDMIVGARGAKNSNSVYSAGNAHVIFGHSSGNPFPAAIDLATFVSGAAGFKITGSAANDELGYSVSSAGDINGDHYDDIIVGSFMADYSTRTDAGVVYVIFGHSTSSAFIDVDVGSFTTGTAGFRIYGAASGDFAGFSVSGAGDMNGDGYDDVILGAPMSTTFAGGTAGISFVIFGHSGMYANIDLFTFTSGSVGFQILGAEAGSQVGNSVSDAGDVNSDGFDDVIVGAKLAGTSLGKTNAGTAFVIFGRRGSPAFADINLSTMSAATGFRIYGAVAGDNLGYSVSSGGDVNVDGVADMLIGIYNSAPFGRTEAGSAVVIFGHSNHTSFPDIDLSEPLGELGFQLYGGADGDRVGTSIQAAGDVNHDGCADFIVGAFSVDVDTLSNTGAAYIIFGSGAAPSSQPSRQPSSQPSRQPTTVPSQWTDPAYRDIDALTFTSGPKGFRFVGTQGATMFGASVAGIGDINGDGIDDVAAGGNLADPLGRTNAGVVVVVFGHSSAAPFNEIDPLTFTSAGMGGFLIYGAAAGDGLLAVSGAGDVNGDQIDDLIVGAGSADPGGINDAGTSYVIFGHNASYPFPAVVDLADFVSGPAGFKVNGNGMADTSGSAVSGAGDVNGDGYDDVIVGAYLAPYLSRDDAGGAYVIFGHSTATAFTDIALATFTTGFRIYGAASYDQLGQAIARAGDVNGDGYDDVIVGAPLGDPLTRNDAGISYVIFGHNGVFADIDMLSFTSGATGFKILGAQAGARSGTSVSSAGDLNNDGYDDLVVGAFMTDYAGRTDCGAVHVIFGRREVPTGDVDLFSMEFGTLGFRVFGDSTDAALGYSASGAGDLNGDGIQDLVIGAYGETALSRSICGVAIVLFGHSNHTIFPDIDLYYPLEHRGYRMFGQVGDRLGFSVSAAGDVNSDGVDDLILGVPYSDYLPRLNSGAGYVIFGSHATPTSQPSSSPSTQPSQQPSSQPSMQPTAQPSRQPSEQPTSMPSQWVDPSYRDQDLVTFHAGANGYRVVGTASEDRFGYSVAGIGDINGDGIDDIASGGQLANSLGRTDAGMIVVIYGHSRATPFPEIDPLAYTFGSGGFMIYGALTDDRLGSSVAAAGDVNGDGIADMIMGARLADFGVTADVGAAYVLFGRGPGNPFPASIDLQSFASGTAGFRVYGILNADRLGIAVSGAGDVNGDGFDDVIIGSHQADPYGRNSAGTAYVLFGHTAAVPFTDVFAANFTTGVVGFRVNGEADVDQLGITVSGAGDVNGDGYDDVIMGALGADPLGRTGAGTSYVIFGHSTGSAFTDIDLLAFTSGATGFKILGSQAASRSGNSVSGAGDVNNDGYDDVIVGNAEYDYLGRTDAGAVYVIFGRRGEPAFTDIDLSTMIFGTLGFRIYGAATSDKLGTSVSGAGDVNGDGIADVIMGADLSNALGRTDGGTTVVIFGHSNQTTFPDIDVFYPLGKLGYRLFGPSGENLGGDVNAAGDVNADGIDDFVIGAVLVDYLTRTNTGAAVVIFGSYATPTSQPSSRPSTQPSRQPTRQPTTQPSQQPTMMPTQWIDPAYRDIDMATFISGPKGFAVVGALSGDQLGRSISGIGDINGDGIDDVAVGACYGDVPAGRADAGVVVVVYGHSTATAFTQVDPLTFAFGTAGFLIRGATNSDQVGISVSRAGDVNGDGVSDMIVGANWFDAPGDLFEAGAAYVIFGRNASYHFPAILDLISFVSGAAGFKIVGGEMDQWLGYSVSSAGDMNGDGFADVIVGAPQTVPLTRSDGGAAHVIFGHSTATAFADINVATFTTGAIGFRIFGAVSNDQTGNSVAGAGDVNGDGYDDVIIGANYADYLDRIDAGTAYVVFGHSGVFTDIDLLTFIAGAAGFRIIGAATSSLTGYAVSGAGDINSDGFDDVVVGASNEGYLGRLSPGVAYVIFGRRGTPAFADIDLSTMVFGTLGFRVYGAVFGDTLGGAVSGAGDVNGDGIQDLIVSAANADFLSRTNCGSAVVVFGHSNHTNFADIDALYPLGHRGFRIFGKANDRFGSSVSAAGDVNNDGIADFAVGAVQADSNTRSNNGAGYIIFGSYATPTSQPSSSPSAQPSRQPSSQPSRQPSIQPSGQPSRLPTSLPSGQPTQQPILRPSSAPSCQPSSQPSRQPSKQPYTRPSSQPSMQPSRLPSAQPSHVPSSQPSVRPSVQPRAVPTSQPSGEPSSQPSSRPSRQPSAQPTKQPSVTPSTQPGAEPSAQPSRMPSGQPSSHPSTQPSAQPTMQPSSQPSWQPSARPSGQPSSQPSGQPSNRPSIQPGATPSAQPSSQPSRQPSARPSGQPSLQPSRKPSSQPTLSPSAQPSASPSVQSISVPSSQPSSQPSKQPSCRPSSQPTLLPSAQPSRHPSSQPSGTPSAQPRQEPSVQPSGRPSAQPSSRPSVQPAGVPSTQPSMLPSRQPSAQPSRRPTMQPSCQPSATPTVAPSAQPASRPSSQPTRKPSSQPTSCPSVQPSTEPTAKPTVAPHIDPTGQPSMQPSSLPSEQPSISPTAQPNVYPSAVPTVMPTYQPTQNPSVQPSSQPSTQRVVDPTIQPSSSPSMQPGGQPSRQPSGNPSSIPSTQPSSCPSVVPTVYPTVQPSRRPSTQPSALPTVAPSSQPSTLPSSVPSAQPVPTPTGAPSVQPSSAPSSQPSAKPSSQPACRPSCQPSTQPSAKPSAEPSSRPSVQPSARPTDQPTVDPTCQPSAQPLSAPSGTPTVPPTTQPAGAPSSQPTSVPSLSFNLSSPSSAPLQSNATIVAITPHRDSLDLHVTVVGRIGAVVYCAALRTRDNTPVSLSAIHRMDSSGAFVSPGQSASVIVSGLLPFTEYDAYCTAMTLEGTEMALSAVIAMKTSTQTQCCKTIHVKLLTASLLERTAMQKALSVVIDVAPTSSVGVQLAFRSTTGAATTAYPASSTFGSTTSLVGQSQYYALIAGDVAAHTLQVVLSGPSAAEYNVSYDSSRIVKILAVESAPPTPQPQSATFSNDGSAVVVAFDAPTDKGGYFNAFPCAKLLNFSGNAVAACQWTDSAKITVYPVYSEKFAGRVLQIGSYVTIFGNTIRAACTRTNVTQCRSWDAVSASQLLVVKPVAAIQPTVIISVPATIGGCSSLTVDVTTSTGSAGRPWVNPQFSVLTTLGATSAALQLENYLNANFSLNPPTIVPYSAFQKGYVYSIKATLCNFLGPCANAVKSVNVLASISAVPVVSVLGKSQRSVYRSSQLVVNSNAYTQSCNGAVSSANLDYTWTIQQIRANGTLAATTLRSSSQSPTVFKLPAYSLSASAQYEVTLSVKSLVSTVSASAQVTVSVLQGNVVAVVTGGSTKQLRVGDSVQLDASQSYNEDVPNKKGAAVGLSFTWACVQIQPAFSATCTIPATDTQDEKLSLIVPFAALNTTALYTVTVSEGSRSSSAQVSVVVTGAVSPTLDITNTVSSVSNFNTGKQLALFGSLILYSPCTASWSIDDQDVDIIDAARTPVSKYLLPSAQTAVPFNLVIKEGVLPQRSTLLFFLTCGSTSTSVTVTTNGAPLPGEFDVSPPSGDELTTVFTFTAIQWTDSDLPLTYQFGFQSVTSLSNLVIVSKSEVSHASTTLPAGAQASSNAINCTLQVFDSVGAFSSVQEAVSVRPVSTERKEESLLKLLQSNTGSVDSTKRVISVVSSALNNVNCSAVRNCSSLNRSPCLRTSGECGPCLSGYIGEAGDRSSLCILAIEVVSNSTNVPCLTAQHCPFAWQVCDVTSSTCSPPPKTCSRNCSDHGECIYVNRVSGNVQPTCLLDDLNCEAVCSCADKFFGDFCEIGVSALRSRREVRSNLISSLHNLTSQEDINLESVSAWSASLYTLSIHPHELSANDVNIVAAIANATLRNAIALQVDSYSNVVGLLKATDTVASLLKYNYNPNEYDASTFNTSRTYQNNTAAAIVHTVSAFGDLVASSMVLGQNATTLLYDNFRLSVHLDIIATNAKNLTIGAPQSAFEQLTHAPDTTVKLSPVIAGAVSTAVAVKQITVYPRSYTPDASAFVSSPLLLQVQSQQGPDGIFDLPIEYLSNIEFTFQHNSPQYHYVHAKSVNFTTVCTKRNESERHLFVCPESGHVLTHNCSQGAGVHTSYCPKPAPGCAKLDVDSADVSIYEGCKIVSFNLTYTVCSCPLRHTNSRRQLASTAEEILLDDSGATNMMVSTVFIADGFADTFSAADDFNSASDVQKVLVVIIMLGVLWIPATLFLGVEWAYSSALQYSTKVHIKQQAAVVDAEAQRSVASYIARTIPEVFRSERFGWSRLWSELISHHALFRLLGKQSKQQRTLVVGKTVTVLTFLLFLTAAFFDVSNPGDDGSCVNHNNEDSCLKRTSPFDFDQTYCQWSDEIEANVSQCTYTTQSMSMKALFYLTVLTTVLTAIATIPIDYLFGIISAPTAQSLKGSKVMNVVKAAVNAGRRLSGVGLASRSVVAPTAPAAAVVKPPNGTSLLRSRSFAILAGSPEDKVLANREVPEEFAQASDAARASISVIEQNSKAMIQRTHNAAVYLKAKSIKLLSPQLPPVERSHSALNDTEKHAPHSIRGAEDANSSGAPVASVPLSSLLCSEVLQQRALMNDGADETMLFDAQWGLLRAERDGKKHVFAPSTAIAISDDVFLAQEEGGKFCKLLPYYSVHHAGLEILHLFMVDLLGRNTPSAKIFQEKFGEEFGNCQVVVMMQKYIASLVLLGLNGLFAYFILLKAFQKGYEWQIQYLVCSIVQFVVELLVFETTECVWLNYSVPLFVHKEVAAAAQKLNDHVGSLVAASAQHNVNAGNNKKHGYFLNAPAHLFVSAHVAEGFPHLMESMIVRSYTGPLPGEIYHTWPHYRAAALSEQHRVEATAREQSPWMLVPTSLIRGATLTMQLFITIPYLYQRVIIRFVQPMIFSGISVVWFTAIQSTAGAVVLSLLFGSALVYVLWRYYKTTHTGGSVAPVTVDEQTVPKDIVIIDIKPIPTFIENDESSESDGEESKESEASLHISSESDSEFGSECDSEWEDQDQDHHLGSASGEGSSARVSKEMSTSRDSEQQLHLARNRSWSSFALDSDDGNGDGDGDAGTEEDSARAAEYKPALSTAVTSVSAEVNVHESESEHDDVYTENSQSDVVSVPSDESEYDEYLFEGLQEDGDNSHGEDHDNSEGSSANSSRGWRRSSK